MVLVGVLTLAACSADEATQSDAQSSETSLAVADDDTVATFASSTSTAAPASTSDEPTTTAMQPDAPIESIGLELELIASVTNPVAIAGRPGSPDLYVVEQRGRIVRLPNGVAEAADVAFDIRGSVSGGNEQGLLGLAFSPDGDELYVNYTDRAGDTIIARYDMVGPVSDPESAEVLLTVDQPRGNHNGGQLAFGPDGYLYIGMGDGGGGGDPLGSGQNPDTLLGSILRIDVNTDVGYAIPSGNPFAAGPSPEIFIIGIRNAWRFGFDSATGDLWIGDVGQDRFEEVTVLRSGEMAGANLGWNEMEGLEPYRDGTEPEGHAGPIVAYAQTSGRCSVTGGEVYRGSDIPDLVGTYLYGDFCSGEVFGIRVDGDEPSRLDVPVVSELTSFGLDELGELLVLSRRGGVFRIVAG